MYEFVIETTFNRHNELATPTMTDDTLLPFDLPTVRRKKVTASFDGGLISSDGGLVLLREAERRLAIGDPVGRTHELGRFPSELSRTDRLVRPGFTSRTGRSR